VSRLPPGLALIVIALAAAGCGVGQDRAEVRAVTAAFYDAVRSDDAEAACAQLSPDTLTALESQTSQSCAGVITRLDYAGGDISGVGVYLTNAKVDLSGGESVFLSKDDGQWLLSALACKAEAGPPREQPMDCEVEA
jgi:hypothetical protein